MSIWIKICGLTSVDAVEAAVRAGADAIGFVFAESPRKVSVRWARELAQDISPSIMRVAVMRHPTQKAWAEVALGFEPDWLQTDAEDFANLDIESGVQRLPVYRDKPDLEFDAVATQQRVLFEGPDSGHAQQVDWKRASSLAGVTQLVLAGGLDDRNVGDAIRQVRPWGVDVSSGVERSRGEKDPEKIAAFISAVRKVERSDAG
jgi:phosphoribosylanthranilate isomerase